ncbi:type II CRISPR RNA-guided endonuclease Cas9 [Alloprevotella sp. OH1205_COT-284]|uniref:type II CRISPR RNA-guided endonuclease Cas9 n=1 Tax=Alloprevotella sp. OH1205_COT-284 TaxID=2491043 RepID=UPI000F5E28DA|nr:type II CRISPR RNA-guided endonuclease Cas9 [Alloprevotella sp. OH1205_COT-284]RRD75954.1 type II CRISPR RNA-guided endonuclease Cas9 [Alloprevotella sp. OH1205_COT-284]
MKNILGLDLGTNSIGWAKVSFDEQGKPVGDIRLGSRIIPMSQDVMSDFEKGVTNSGAKERTSFRSIRRLRERCLQRRERLFRVLHTLRFLPEHFDAALGWDKNDNKTYGKFLNGEEPKVAWRRGKDGKMEFIFMEAFEEMLADFVHRSPKWKAGTKVPLDWTLYYLRNKALTQQVSKEELAWILLSFNQKRGYYQLRGEEEEENVQKRVEFMEAVVVKVEAEEAKKGKDTWYNLHLDNGLVYRRTSKTPLESIVGQKHAFILTTEYEKDGVTPKRDKEGNDKYSIRMPKEDDWTLKKKRTEHDLKNSGKHVGTFIYEQLLAEPTTKIRGNFVHTIERYFYKNELKAILEKQCEFIPELTDKAMLHACAEELYARNLARKKSLCEKDLVYLLIDDLIFYQRPLKSKKGLIDNCPYESYSYVDKTTGEIKEQPIKCAAKSNPYFQEFRLWQFIGNLRLFDRTTEAEVTSQYLATEDDYERLFVYLNDRKEIKQETLLKEFFQLKKPKGKDAEYPLRWNYAEDKEKVYPCNETRAAIFGALKKAGLDASLIDTKEKEYALWHLLYSVEDKLELEGALRKWNLGEDFVQAFARLKPFEKSYAAYSEKAIKKLLTLMRRGNRWAAESIDVKTQKRIEAVIKGDIEEKLKAKIGKYPLPLKQIDDFKALPVWVACYIVYGRHSESGTIEHWEKPESLRAYINGFKQHSLRNPIVEQVVLETLRTVHDIWKEYGQIDEIHVEMGRDMKKTSAERQKDTKKVLENETRNMRIKYLLAELKNDSKIENVRAYSPGQQEILRIYEEGALANLKEDDKDYDEISKIAKSAHPTSAELTRYKLWLEQKYRSPYTGRPISLSHLFTTAYEIEHIIPQARYFDDSMSNKVICETEINREKGSMLGYEFIKKRGGEIFHSPILGDLKLLKADDYERFIEDQYQGRELRTKKKKLLMEDIPEDFVQRQLNDSRHISKLIKGLLSNIVREEGEEEETSKHLIPCNGSITDRLKKDWGLNDVWNSLVYPRFQRLNQLTNSEAFGYWDKKDGKRVFQTQMPLELQQGFRKKRIDHRHHAMDALVIACTSRNIVNFLNNESAKDTQRREDLRRLLCVKGRQIRKPWETFTQDAEAALRGIVVSFKNNIRILNKATNRYEHYDEEGKKKLRTQKGEAKAVRKPLHKDTVYGKVNLKRKGTVTFAKALENIPAIVDKDLRHRLLELSQQGYDKNQLQAYFKKQNYQFKERDVTKVEIWTFSDDKEPLVATRKAVDTTFDKKTIEKITDTGIQKILLNFLEYKGGDPALAFSPEGITEMNANIASFNNGKPHQPIKKVRLFEPLGQKFCVGQKGNKKSKFVEAQKGTNLYFAIYEDSEGKRHYATIPLNEVIERLKQGLSPVPNQNESGVPLKFWLSPDDLVYVPTPEEQDSQTDIKKLDKSRIYKMVSSTGKSCLFVPHIVTKAIQNKVEFEALNKMERAIHLEAYCAEKLPVNLPEAPMIKAVCWKLEVDRLGNILNVIR